MKTFAFKKNSDIGYRVNPAFRNEIRSQFGRVYLFQGLSRMIKSKNKVLSFLKTFGFGQQSELEEYDKGQAKIKKKNKLPPKKTWFC